MSQNRKYSGYFKVLGIRYLLEIFERGHMFIRSWILSKVRFQWVWAVQSGKISQVNCQFCLDWGDSFFSWANRFIGDRIRQNSIY